MNKVSPRSFQDARVLATAYFRLDKRAVWSIRGAGAMCGDGIPIHPRLRAILDALKSDGIDVVGKRVSGPTHPVDVITFSADFDDGGLAVETGNYWHSPRGGSITGVNALSRLIRLLNLRVTPQTSRAWGVQATERGERPPQEHLRRDVRRSRPKSEIRRK